MMPVTSQRGGRRGVAVGLAAAAALGATAAAVSIAHRPAATPKRAPAPARAQPRVIARVGSAEITDADLARHQAISELSFGISLERQSLDDLCDRALLVLAAREHGVSVAEAEIEQEKVHRKLIIGAVAQPAAPMTAAASLVAFSGTGRRGVASLAHPSPLDRGAELLAARGISEQDLTIELAAETLASRVRQRLVYDPVVLSKKELSAGREVQQRLRRQRGEPALASLLASLRAKWAVELVKN
jgi:hypothetical protein